MLNNIVGYWAYIQGTYIGGKGGGGAYIWERLLARRASRDGPRTKNGRLWTPKFWGEREIIFNYFPKYINISKTK
jgi:hypothetical protein